MEPLAISRCEITAIQLADKGEMGWRFINAGMPMTRARIIYRSRDQWGQFPRE